VLVAAQAATAMTLMVAAGLFIRSYLNLVTQDTGLTEDVVALSVARSPQATADESHRSVGRVIEHLRRLPAVVDAAAGVGAMVDESLALTPVRFHEGPKWTSLKVVTANYFDVLGIELVGGRRFADSEGDVVVISESLARALWPGGGCS
jgi:hypothetical protein